VAGWRQGCGGEVTLAEVLQLYAPLAGLLGVVFYLGVLSNRVKTLESQRHDDLERAERERQEMKAAALAVVAEGATDHDTLILVAADVKTIKEQMAGMASNYTGIQRQLGNLMQKRSGMQELHND
jgi:hypothetical protein